MSRSYDRDRNGDRHRGDRGGGRPGGRDDEHKDQYWADRRAKREKIYMHNVDGVYGDSPSSGAERDEIDEILKSKKKTKKKAAPSDSDDSDSSSDDSSQEDSSDSSDSADSRKRKRSRKSKSKSKKKRKSKSKSKSKKKKAKKKKAVSSSSESDSSEDGKEEAVEWAEHTAVAVPDEQDDGVEVGPVLPAQQDFNSKTQNFGGALLPGEGDAMANYVAEGKRIPRRGEIGLESHEIAAYEEEGFVMSGSRHRRMEAVRVRKENQIYSADERRALAMFHYEEHQKKENKILGDLRELISSRK